MLPIIITVGIAFLLQGLLGFFQMKHLTNEFLKLRKKERLPLEESRADSGQERS